MLTLYYFPGSYSMAAHILLEEGGTPYERKLVDLRKGEHRTDAYRRVHPRGVVPALRLDDGEVLVENTAILPYLGKRFGLWPTDAIEEARALSLIGYFATGVASAHARALHPDQFASDATAFPAIKAAGLRDFEAHLQAIDDLLAGRQWLLQRYSACDAYCFGFYSWGVRRQIAVRRLANYAAFIDRMLLRPAVRRVVDDEKIVLA